MLCFTEGLFVLHTKDLISHPQEPGTLLLEIQCHPSPMYVVKEFPKILQCGKPNDLQHLDSELGKVSHFDLCIYS